MFVFDLENVRKYALIYLNEIWRTGRLEQPIGRVHKCAKSLELLQN